jgi:hypothetical protein
MFRSDPVSLATLRQKMVAWLFKMKNPPKLDLGIQVLIYVIICFFIPIASAYAIKCDKEKRELPKFLQTVMNLVETYQGGVTGLKYDPDKKEEAPAAPAPAPPPPPPPVPHQPVMNVERSSSEQAAAPVPHKPVMSIVRDHAGSDEASMIASANAPGGFWEQLGRVNPVSPEENQRRLQAGGQPCIICNENYSKPGKNTCGTNVCNGRHGSNQAKINVANGGPKPGRKKKAKPTQNAKS